MRNLNNLYMTVVSNIHTSNIPKYIYITNTPNLISLILQLQFFYPQPNTTFYEVVRHFLQLKDANVKA